MHNWSKITLRDRDSWKNKTRDSPCYWFIQQVMETQKCLFIQRRDDEPPCDFEYTLRDASIEKFQYSFLKNQRKKRENVVSHFLFYHVLLRLSSVCWTKWEESESFYERIVVLTKTCLQINLMPRRQKLSVQDFLFTLTRLSKFVDCKLMNETEVIPITCAVTSRPISHLSARIINAALTQRILVVNYNPWSSDGRSFDARFFQFYKAEH